MAYVEFSTSVHSGTYGKHMRVWRLRWETQSTTKAGKNIWRKMERHFFKYADMKVGELSLREWSSFNRNIKVDTIAVWTDIHV